MASVAGQVGRDNEAEAVRPDLTKPYRPWKGLSLHPRAAGSPYDVLKKQSMLHGQKDAPGLPKEKGRGGALGQGEVIAAATQVVTEAGTKLLAQGIREVNVPR